jgi:bilin biosynthesis protein
MASSAFVQPLPLPLPQPCAQALPRSHLRSAHPPLRRLRASPRIRSRAPPKMASAPQTTEETFALDAGRDLFFAGMDGAMATALLDAPLGSLPSADDRFIAAERLQFFPSAAATDAIIRFVARFNTANLDDYVLEDRVARRKCIETLGRYKGAFERERVFACVTKCLDDPDPYMVEVAVWTLAEVGVAGRDAVLAAVLAVLDNDAVAKRVIIQTLMRAGYKPALPRIRELVSSADGATASAAMTAVCMLGGDPSGMDDVVRVLKSENLGERRSAIEDITLSKHVPALAAVAIAPNSLVLRARAVRALLESSVGPGAVSGDAPLDDETAMLIDRLIWDHPSDLDLLDMSKDTKKARDVDRNVRQLYKNDAIYPYLAARTLAEDHQAAPDGIAGAAVLKSFLDQPYFDYFGAYHVFKTLGWLQYKPSLTLLLDNAENLPPRFFNHAVGAVLAASELGDPAADPVFARIAAQTQVWELKYACMIGAERLGIDGGALRESAKEDQDCLIRARARNPIGFAHLRSSF